jgi:hypothetical protein
MYRSLPERTYPPHWRVAAAFLVVPAFAALSFAIAMPLYAGLPTMAERIWRSALIYGLVGAYPQTVVFGVPAYFVFRRHFGPHLINCAGVGAVVATLPWLLLTLVSSPDQASIGNRATIINGSYTAFGWLMNAQFLSWVALAGAIGGALFWAIAAAGSGAGKVR